MRMELCQGRCGPNYCSSLKVAILCGVYTELVFWVLCVWVRFEQVGHPTQARSWLVNWNRSEADNGKSLHLMGTALPSFLAYFIISLSFFKKFRDNCHGDPVAITRPSSNQVHAYQIMSINEYTGIRFRHLQDGDLKLKASTISDKVPGIWRHHEIYRGFYFHDFWRENFHSIFIAAVSNLPRSNTSL